MQQFDSLSVLAEARSLRAQTISAFLVRLVAWFKAKRLQQAAASQTAASTDRAALVG